MYVESAMLESDQCWQHARECLDLAAKTKDPIQNRQLFKMAESWARLAEAAERQEGQPKSATE